MTEDDREQELRARELHDGLDSNETANSRSAQEAAAIVLKGLLIVHGGALVALLGFIATLASSEAGRALSVTALVAPLGKFAWGIAFSLFATALAHVSYGYRAAYYSELERTTVYPYFEETKPSKNSSRNARWAFFASSACVGVSLALLGTGIDEVSRALPTVFQATP